MPLSPYLFNTLLLDLEGIMRKGDWGVVKVRGEKIYTLLYTDDMMLLADEEDGMRCMIAKLERYLEEKGLELNVAKFKILRFSTGGRRIKKSMYNEDGGQEVGGSEGIQILRAHTTEERGTEGSSEGRGKEDGGGTGAGMGHREKTFWERVRKKNVILRAEFWSGR